MLAGKNTAAVRHENGSWEILSFAKAELIGFQTWRLTELLRGLGGEEDLAREELKAGARFVLLDEAIVPLALINESLSVASTYRIGPIGRDYADPACIEFTALPSNKALLPYAPVQLRAKRMSTGVSLSFIRRSRVDADDWENVEIALGEDSEAYEIEFLKNGAVTRLLKVTQSPAVYDAADELADFGEQQSHFSLRLYQMSRKVGRGFVCQHDIQIQS